MKYVKTEYIHLTLPPTGFLLQKGGVLSELQVAFERYGTINPQEDNIILICHALTGDAHVAGFHSAEEEKPGWWNDLVGPGKALDTQRYHIICSNILGGCRGTTGPGSLNPLSGRPYGADFPEITIGDIVEVQKLLLDKLGIKRLYGVIGGSAGGIQVLEWCYRYPDFITKAVCIAAAASLSAQALSFDIIGRNIIMADPKWNNGNYYAGGGPDTGLALARMLAHITYLSQESMSQKFGRRKKNRPNGSEKFNTDFQVEGYLNYQGQKFVERFDANSYLHITTALNHYALEDHGNKTDVYRKMQSEFLIISVSSDWLFPAEQSKELAENLLRAGRNVTYCNFESEYGHDSFLIKDENFSRIVASFFSPLPQCQCGPLKKDYSIICALMREKSRMLDLGCGTGEVLCRIFQEKGATGMGIDIDYKNIIHCNNRRIPIFQVNLDEGLKMIPDNYYDYAVLSYTLFEVHKPHLVLEEMLRVARLGIVAFSNFANWKHRLRLSLRGLLPLSRSLPYSWYDTPNIHYLTLKEFMRYCRRFKIQPVKIIPIGEGIISRLLIRLGLANLGADRLIIKLCKEK